MSHPLIILDVFAEALLEGNQLAVVLDANDLDTERMQAIAREMNFSETTFVLGQHEGSWQTRIFTPAVELPFAGHPTLGTAFALRKRHERVVSLDLKAGLVEVVFDDEQGLGWITPPEVSFRNEVDRARVARVLGLKLEAIASDLPVLETEVGPQFLLVPIVSREYLAKVKPDKEAWEALRNDGIWAFGLMLFSLERTDQTDIGARMIFTADSVREDPATGSANACLAAYLARYRPPENILVVAQGVEMGRPSRLHLDCGPPIRVGGRVIECVRGEIHA